MTTTKPKAKRREHEPLPDEELMRRARHFLLRLQPDLFEGRSVIDEIEERLAERKAPK